MGVTEDRSATADSDELAEFGYRQELDRTLGNFHTFAAGISYISILTGTFQLFYFGFAFGGPAYWWSWPMVFAGQLMVALGYQITLPQISDFFQFYGDGTGENDFATNAVILGTVLIIFTTIINAIGVPGADRVGHHRRPDHPARDDGGDEHQLAGDRHRRSAVHRARRARQHDRRPLPVVGGDRDHGGARRTRRRATSRSAAGASRSTSPPSSGACSRRPT